MITNVILPPATSLSPLVEEALTNVKAEEFIQNHLRGIFETLEHNPLNYRNYGAFWWAIKALMTQHGYELGEEQENVTKDHFTYADDVTLLCAAWNYQNVMIEDGYIYQSVHTYQVEVDGDYESIEYSIEDSDMEALAIG